MIEKRIAIATLTLSALGFGSIISYEGYSDKAYIPVKGDVPTIGFGTTQGVKMGDKINPVQAVSRALRDVQKFEGALKECVKVPLSQGEYDAYISLSYNIGSGNFCKSTLVKELNKGNYEKACEEIKKWVCAPDPTGANAKKVDFNPCGKGKAPLKGLVERREKEYAMCVRNGNELLATDSSSK